MIVYLVYGEDWVYGHDTGIKGVFLNQWHALQFAAKLSKDEPRYHFVAKEWEVK